MLTAAYEAFGLAAPPLAILPLGTGNDMARVLGWGAVFSDRKVDSFLTKVRLASLGCVDRWKVEAARFGSEKRLSGLPNPEEYQTIFTLNNYFSIGCDAKVALDFHRKREKSVSQRLTDRVMYTFRNPSHLLNPRYRNHIWYTRYGLREVRDHSFKDLKKDVEVICDGRVLDLPDVEGLTVQNIPSYLGGADLWRADEERGFGPSRFDDHMFEVFGVLGSWHTGKLKVGMGEIIKLCQCQEIIIRFRTARAMPIQVDGEAWEQPACVIRIGFYYAAPVLISPKGARGTSQLNEAAAGEAIDEYERQQSTASRTTGRSASSPDSQSDELEQHGLQLRLAAMERAFNDRESQLLALVGKLQTENENLLDRIEELENLKLDEGPSTKSAHESRTGA